MPDSTALQVLTNRELFRCVASWMPGWPVALDEFVLQRVIAPANSGRRGKKRMATDMRRRLMLRALGGRTLPMAIVQELRHADDEQHALHLLAMVHDLALQSATLRTKDSLSFEHALSHALLHGARGPVVQWLLDMQPYTRPRRPTDDRTNDSGDDTDGNDKRDDEWTALWCDAIEGFADDVRTLDALRARMFVDLSASASSLDQAREALRVRSEPSLVLLQWCRAAWPQLKVPFEVVDAAAALGKQDVVSWLCDDEHSERFSSRALQNAAAVPPLRHVCVPVGSLRGRCADDEHQDRGGDGDLGRDNDWDSGDDCNRQRDWPWQRDADTDHRHPDASRERKRPDDDCCDGGRCGCRRRLGAGACAA
ncbi:hypothetical protein PINS_up002583 [Pythium insidiosum]|nr:hypothetical protein PINS_up002583 [Pythium insidiosum]